MSVSTRVSFNGGGVQDVPLIWVIKPPTSLTVIPIACVAVPHAVATSEVIVSNFVPNVTGKPLSSAHKSAGNDDTGTFNPPPVMVTVSEIKPPTQPPSLLIGAISVATVGLITVVGGTGLQSTPLTDVINPPTSTIGNISVSDALPQAVTTVEVIVNSVVPLVTAKLSSNAHKLAGNVVIGMFNPPPVIVTVSDIKPPAQPPSLLVGITSVVPTGAFIVVVGATATGY